MNARTSSLRRTCCALGAAATLGLALAAPASAVVLPDPIGSGLPPEQPSPGGVITVAIDDNALELLQVGGGLLAGLALAGAGVALASRRHHSDPAPA
ncbi:hypothetical protein [Intrasporangium calvum]|uniref:hypothetical protein n=1 Tax=Intrasporangium calvum TaxID=53358 RepID=UPI000DF5FF91|nr:hypothetical protein [Intrasporangium calvum]AXG14625.1 hypothetical protein DN585_15480 [Intrasporangium calvum]